MLLCDDTLDDVGLKFDTTSCGGGCRTDGMNFDVDGVCLEGEEAKAEESCG